VVEKGVHGIEAVDSHMVGQLLEVTLLLGNLLAELDELLLLTHADSVVLRSLLAALEGISVTRVTSQLVLFLILRGDAYSNSGLWEARRGRGRGIGS
jgi:hypothetical protein